MAYRNKQPFFLKNYKPFAHIYCFTENSTTLIQVPSNSMKNLPGGPVKATSTTKGPGHRRFPSRVQSTAPGSNSFSMTGPKVLGQILPQLLKTSCGITKVNVEWQENKSLGLDYCTQGLQSTSHPC